MYTHFYLWILVFKLGYFDSAVVHRTPLRQIHILKGNFQSLQMIVAWCCKNNETENAFYSF